MDADTLGIPELDTSLQLLSLDGPVIPYGTVPRGVETGGVLHFFVADVKFTRLLANPGRILATRCVGAVEPNCSTGPDIPLAQALYGIYCKRAAARYWQGHGIRICVDLNVDDRVLPWSLLGVPRGWRSYAVRKHRHHGMDWIVRRHELAQDHSGISDPFFVVVGGGREVVEECGRRGWHHVPEHCRLVRTKEWRERWARRAGCEAEAEEVRAGEEEVVVAVAAVTEEVGSGEHVPDRRSPGPGPSWPGMA